jgi:hypothetical protein
MAKKSRPVLCEKFCSQLSIYFNSHVAFRKAYESLVCSDKTSNLNHYVQNQVQLLSLLVLHKCIVFIVFNTGSRMAFSIYFQQNYLFHYIFQLFLS